MTVDLATLLANDPNLPDLNDLPPNTSLLSGPIGGVVAKVLESDVRTSVTNLAKLG